MLRVIFSSGVVLLLASLVANSSCKMVADAEFSEMPQQLKEMKSEIEKLKKVNNELAELMHTMLKEKNIEEETARVVRKREVISSLKDLPVEILSALRGPAGRDGSPGKDGAVGEPGLQGVPGVQGPPGNSVGTVYTRWGRTTCGSDSALLYEGFAGNSRRDMVGGGTNYLCIPYKPEYNKWYGANGGTGTYYQADVVGVEYHTYSYGIFPPEANFQNAPCAACLTNNRPAVIMIPARRTCAEGWNKEYEGYLMSGYNGYNHQTTFECVDANPEYVHGEIGRTEGNLFVFNRPTCSQGVECPPYFADRALTCVVCSK